MELFTWFEIIKRRKKKKKKIPRPSWHSSLLQQRPRLRCAKVVVVWPWVLTDGKALGTQLPGHTEAQYPSLQFPTWTSHLNVLGPLGLPLDP